MLTPNTFEVKVRLDKLLEGGTTKKVTETYVFDAMSHTEAETKAIEELAPFSQGLLDVTTVRRVHYAEVVLGTGDRYYDCKVAFITINEKTSMEQQQNVRYLVQAEGFDEALCKVHELMKGGTIDYRVISVKETNILDYYESEK